MYDWSDVSGSNTTRRRQDELLAVPGDLNGRALPALVTGLPRQLNAELRVVCRQTVLSGQTSNRFLPAFFALQLFIRGDKNAGDLITTPRLIAYPFLKRNYCDTLLQNNHCFSLHGGISGLMVLLELVDDKTRCNADCP